MAQNPNQPTLKQLLTSETLSEAQVVFGQQYLDKQVVHVVASLEPPPRPGALLVARTGMVETVDPALLKTLAGLIIVRPYVVAHEAAAGASSQALAPVAIDVDLQRLTQICRDAGIALVLMPGFGEPLQLFEDIRIAFVEEVKRRNSRFFAELIRLVLEEGLTGLVEHVSALVNRPVSVEGPDFKVLAAKNMGPTPASQQRPLKNQCAELIALKSKSGEARPPLVQQAVRIGRRMVVPVILQDTLVGYISATVRAGDDFERINEILVAAAAACMVDFSYRQKDATIAVTTYKSLLKDLLSGRPLSASDTERIERHFGFDLCDSLLVFAIKAQSGSLAQEIMRLADKPYVITEVEGTLVVVGRVSKKAGRTWQQEADLLANYLRKTEPELRLQIGVSRQVAAAVELPEAYMAARQALIIGSMIHGDEPFVMSYGDLGIKRLLYMMIDHPELERFYEENLAPLEAYDAEWESELVPTLRVYLKEGANLNSAARALFIHRHTLRYRLEQIAEILEADIDSQEVLLNLQIAFLIKDMKGKT